MSDIDDLDGTNFEEIAETARSLSPTEASDDELIRIIFAYDSDEIEGLGSLTTRAMATFAIRSRGYVVTGDPGDVEIYDPDGEEVVWDDVV